MKKIDISTKKYPNTFALVDNEDYERVNNFGKWHAHQTKEHIYVAIYKRIKGTKKSKFILMHRFILNYPKKKCIDHRNHNRFDNQKNNIRLATYSENQYNKKLNKNNTSGYKGVRWHKRAKKYLAQIKYKRRNFHLGSFICKTEAAKEYNKAALKYFGQFACLNVI